MEYHGKSQKCHGNVTEHHSHGTSRKISQSRSITEKHRKSRKVTKNRHLQRKKYSVKSYLLLENDQIECMKFDNFQFRLISGPRKLEIFHFSDCGHFWPLRGPEISQKWNFSNFTHSNERST